MAVARTAAQDAALAHCAERMVAFEPGPTRTFSCAGVQHRVGTFVHRLTGIVMHLVPGGAFVLGQDDALPRELPRQTCQLAPFLVGRFPVLQREWDLLPGDDQRAHVGGSLPISGVSWASARAWLASAGLRLPSEREWEAACRAGSTQAYPWGTGLDGRAAWFLENSGGAPRDCTLHVQQPNAFGLVDKLGLAMLLAAFLGVIGHMVLRLFTRGGASHG